jgi:hypothetical protein
MGRWPPKMGPIGQAVWPQHGTDFTENRLFPRDKILVGATPGTNFRKSGIEIFSEKNFGHRKFSKSNSGILLGFDVLQYIRGGS